MYDKTYEEVLIPLKEKRGFYIFLFLSEFSLEAVGCGNTNGICLGGSIKIPGKGMNYQPLWFLIRSVLFPRGNLVVSALTLLAWEGPRAEEPAGPRSRGWKGRAGRGAEHAQRSLRVGTRGGAPGSRRAAAVVPIHTPRRPGEPRPWTTIRPGLTVLRLRSPEQRIAG